MIVSFAIRSVSFASRPVYIVDRKFESKKYQFSFRLYGDMGWVPGQAYWLHSFLGTSAITVQLDFIPLFVL